MFFEGSEKKVEIILSPNQPSLFDIEESFWHELVKRCNATILSEIKNEKVHAYLLSESSLFVWKDYILMLTCGETKLIDSALFFVEKFGKENIDSLIFQRKNEYRSHLQPTQFLDDVHQLRKNFEGKALRFGKIHGHYNLLFHLDRPFTPSENDTTTEFLLYDISKETSSFLTRENLKPKDIRDFFNLEEILPGFKIDDHVFKPYGYSLNAIKDNFYYTIHVTPQETSPYVSFETNLNLCEKTEGILHHFLEVFKPGSFDLVRFNTERDFDFGKPYIQTAHNKETLTCGYEVDYRYYYKENEGPVKPHYL